MARAALLVPESISLGRFTFGMEVGQLWVGESAQGRGPGPVGSDGVTTYAQNLGISLLKPAVILPEEGGLRGSTRCEVEHVE